MAAGTGTEVELVRCTQGCDVTDLLNRLEQRINQLAEDWQQVRAGIDTLTQQVGH
jgi:hypothetical protein